MAEEFATPQDAEDAFYDALDDADAGRMQGVWDDSPEIACLLPMQPFVHGSEVHKLWEPLAKGDVRLDIQVRHVRWLEVGDIAIHYVEESVSVAGSPKQPPMYATNVFRKMERGWRMILHQNSPAPPPPGGMGLTPGEHR
jgi:ketosteroid isomerase-like protein